MRASHFLRVAAVLVAGAGCKPAASSLWLYHAEGSELDLVLVDHEPPPF